MRKFEINGNLDDEIYGLKRYDIFERVICIVRNYFIEVFGLKIMESIPLYIDNAMKKSGYTPITTRILGQYLIIKLHVDDGDREPNIAYQFSHELMHYVFYAKMGIEKAADDREESFCSAASLIVIHHLYPDDFQYYNEYTKELDYIEYRKGVELAEQVGYDLSKLKELM